VLSRGANARPQYVEYGSHVTAPPPSTVENAILYGFFVKGDYARIVDLCDQVFNSPSGGAIECAPLWGPWMLLTFGDAPKLKSIGLPRIVLPEKQVVFQVPVSINYKRKVAGASNPSSAWFAPFIWVNSAITMADGREVYGYPKSFGKVVLDPVDFGFALDTLGGDSDDIWEPHTLLKLIPGHDIIPVPADVAAVDAKLTEGMPAEMNTLFMNSIHTSWTQIFLKQFRAIDDGSAACLQQITAAKYDVHMGHPEILLNREYELIIVTKQSDTVVSQTGIYDQPTRTPFRVNLNMKMNRGSVLWPPP
jgi:hypothetical protein